MENKPRHYKHIYFNIKLYKNKPRHYKHIYFNIKLYENKSRHYCNLYIYMWTIFQIGLQTLMKLVGQAKYPSISL